MRIIESSPYHIIFTSIKPHWIVYPVVMSVGEDSNGEPMFLENAEDNWGKATDPLKGFAIIEGFIKWDGCQQFDFNDGIHWDSDDDLYAFCEMLKTLRLSANRILAELEGVNDN